MAKGKGPSGGSKGSKIGRDAENGQFIPVGEARRRPRTTTVETIKRPKSKGR